MSAARTGRKPTGPQIVQRLEGSQAAKVRLEVMLETITGQLTVAQACEKLGIGESRFHALRNETLQAMLKTLEPKPLGRPSNPTTAESLEIEQLKTQLEQSRIDLDVVELQLNLARIHPGLIGDRYCGSKKNTRLKRQH